MWFFNALSSKATCNQCQPMSMYMINHVCCHSYVFNFSLQKLQRCTGKAIPVHNMELSLSQLAQNPISVSVLASTTFIHTLAIADATCRVPSLSKLYTTGWSRIPRCCPTRWRTCLSAWDGFLFRHSMRCRRGNPAETSRDWQVEPTQLVLQGSRRRPLPHPAPTLFVQGCGTASLLRLVSRLAESARGRQLKILPGSQPARVQDWSQDVQGWIEPCEASRPWQ